MTGSVEYSAYRNAKHRCSPGWHDHENYYDRGIRFLFVSFEEFFAEVGPRPEGKFSSGKPHYLLDRKDNNGNYEPGNIRWLRARASANNRRQTTGTTYTGVAKAKMKAAWVLRKARGEQPWNKRRKNG
jgi:hypothetical protein